MNKTLETILTIYPLYFIITVVMWKWITIYQKNNENKFDSILDIMKKQEKIIEELKNKLEKKDIEPIETRVEEAHTKIDIVDKKIDRVEIDVKKEIITTNKTLDERIKMEIEKAIQLRAYLSTEEREKVNLEIIRDNERRMLDLDMLDKKLSRVVEDVMDIYFKNNYFAREHAYDSNTGIFNMPNITEQTKAKDVEEIYNNFWTLMNKNVLMRDLSLIYDVNTLDTKVFLMERYIIPEYATRLENMIEDWQNIQENIRISSENQRIADQIARDKEEAERKRKESERGKLETTIDKILEEIKGGQ